MSNLREYFKICSTQATPAMPLPTTTNRSTLPSISNTYFRRLQLFRGSSHEPWAITSLVWGGARQGVRIRQQICARHRYFLHGSTSYRVLIFSTPPMNRWDIPKCFLKFVSVPRKEQTQTSHRRDKKKL